MTVKELRAEAKRLGITGYSKMNKGQLEAEIGHVEDEADDNYGNMTRRQFGRHLSTLSKGEARKLRKQMRAQGYTGHAAVRRAA